MSTSNYQKYQTSNPVMQKIIGRFQGRVFELASELQPKSIIDLGCGEGMMLETLEPLGPFDYLGMELNPKALAIAKRKHTNRHFVQGDILKDIPEGAKYDLAICLEVLEHLEEPIKAVQKIAASTLKTALISVPWEPYFQLGNLCRGKYLPTLGNHPEHIQHFNPKSFANLLRPYFSKVEIVTCFPWIIAVASHQKKERPALMN